jgi:hypothetical protein
LSDIIFQIRVFAVGGVRFVFNSDFADPCRSSGTRLNLKQQLYIN